MNTNPLIDLIRPTEAVAAYERIRLGIGMDELIFQCVHTVTLKRKLYFQLPSSSSEYGQKHQEVQAFFGRLFLANEKGTI
jgi:hypothetical protein